MVRPWWQMDRRVRKAATGRLPPVKMPTPPLSSAKRRVYGLKHRASLFAQDRPSLWGIMRISMLQSGLFILSGSRLDKRPIPLDQPSETPPGLHRRREKTKKARTSPKPVNVSSAPSPPPELEMIALRFRNSKVTNSRKTEKRSVNRRCV